MNFFMSCCKRKCRDSNPDTAFAMDALAGHWDTITPHLPGAVHRIRTQAPLARPTDFQDRTLQPLGYFCICIIGGPCRTRTYDPPVMSRMLWPTELRVQKMVETAGVAPTYVHWSSDWCQIFYDENTGPKMLINILIGTHECQGIIYSLTASWRLGLRQPYPI